MLLTLEQTKRLSFLENSKNEAAYFVFKDGGDVSKEDLKYALEMHETYSFAFGKPFIQNVDVLIKRLKEIEG